MGLPHPVTWRGLQPPPFKWTLTSGCKWDGGAPSKFGWSGGTKKIWDRSNMVFFGVFLELKTTSDGQKNFCSCDEACGCTPYEYRNPPKMSQNDKQYGLSIQTYGRIPVLLAAVVDLLPPPAGIGPPGGGGRRVHRLSRSALLDLTQTPDITNGLTSNPVSH